MTEPKTAKDALLPCPFCGCKEIKQWKVKHEDGVILHTVRCSGCHEGMDGHATAAGVAEKWNTRAQPGQAPSNQPAIAELIAVLIDLNNTRHAQNAIHKFLPDTLDDLFNKYESKYGMTYFDMTAPPLTPASDHCKDCCCAKAWWALGVSEYDGKSIAEHILDLRFKNQELHKHIDQLFVAPASDIPGLREDNLHALRVIISKRTPETNALEHLHVFNEITKEIETLYAARQVAAGQEKK